MPTEMESVLDKLLLLVFESEQYHDSCPADATHQAYRRICADVRLALAEMRRRTKAASKRYVVAVVGLSNVGKSTLLNALFGLDLAPRRNGPCTAAPIEFVYGENFQVAVNYFDSIRKPVWECPNVENVHARLEALASGGGAEQSRAIQRVVVHAPLPLLKNGLVIADTPGFGAAQVEGAEGSHEESVKKYLQSSVSQVFWVVLGEQGILKGEKDFHDKFFGQLCDDVIVTGCDDWEQRDKERFRQRFSQAFESRMPMFHFASGKLGRHARQTGSLEELEQAGIPAIEERIKSLSDTAGRMQGVENALLELAKDLLNWHADFCTENDTRRVSFWRPDSFDRWLAANPGNPTHQKLTKALTIQE